MDKIDVVLFKFSMERTVSKEYKKMYWRILIPIIIFLVFDIILMFFSPTWYVQCCILCLVFLLIMSRIMEGKLGTKKWKYKCMEIYWDNFKQSQSKLLEIINAEEMNCQQVYNLLTKRHGRMVQGADKQTLIISTISLVIACTSIFVSP